VIWSRRLSWLTTRASVFWTRWSLLKF